VLHLETNFDIFLLSFKCISLPGSFLMKGASDEAKHSMLRLISTGTPPGGKVLPERQQLYSKNGYLMLPQPIVFILMFNQCGPCKKSFSPLGSVTMDWQIVCDSFRVFNFT
jgi:hypothetical protein